jgi:hypothetical protein
MLKCEYCGKEIGLLAVRYTWIEKGKKAIHDKCLKKQEFEKKMEAEKKERTKFYEELKKQSQEKPEKNN